MNQQQRIAYDEVLRGFGYTDLQIKELRASGAVA
jgi:hypothetical protein